jgi:hypothetical protein
MRIEQSPMNFNPVTIHLDSQDELDAFLEIVNYGYSNSPGGSDAERLARDIRDRMAESGWQSSSYNC